MQTVTQQHDEIQAQKAAMYAQLLSDNQDTEYSVQITVPVRGLLRAIQLHVAMLAVVVPLVDELESETQQDVDMSSWVLDDDGNAVD